MKLLALLLSAILAGAVLFVVTYRNNGGGISRDVIKNLLTKSDRSQSTHGTPAPVIPKAPEANLVEPVTIRTPEGELTIPKGSRVRVIEKVKSGMVAINYQGYTAPIPESAVNP